MGEIVNLRREKKRRARAEAAAQAAESRARSGRTVAERSAERVETERGERLLDGARLGPAGTPPGRDS